MIHKLIIESNFASDTTGLDYLKTDTLTFTTMKKSEYGSLNLKTKNFEPSLHATIIMKKNGEVVLNKLLSGKNEKIDLMLPGEFDVEILFDLNMNGIWDTGDYWKKQHPERVIPRGQKLAIKPNFENEIVIDIDEIQKNQ